MKILRLSEIRTCYHDYLLGIHKNWNKNTTGRNDTAGTRVSDTLYLWNNDNKIDYWRYLAGELNINEAYRLIKMHLSENGSTEERKIGYCQMFDDFKEYFEIEWGGITRVIDEETIEVFGKLEKKEIFKLRTISVNDGYSFSYNFEALNACFGTNMHTSLQSAIWNPKDGCMVWFPHLAKVENGRYVAGSGNVDWKNYFEDEGETIVMMIYPDEIPAENMKLSLTKDINPTHTFMKMGPRDFRYVGTFLLDYNCSTPRYKVQRRIKDSIDLSIWADGYDTEYFDTFEIGKDVFKSMYIGNKYKKQKEYIANFLKNEARLRKEENDYYKIIRSFLDKYTLMKLSQLNAEGYEAFLADLKDVFVNAFNHNTSVAELKKRLGDYQEFGLNFYDLLDLRKTGANSINDRIKNCPFGTVAASIIFTIYNEEDEVFLYTLDETTTDKILFSLGLKLDSEIECIDKLSRIYFWRYCDEELLGWSDYRFYQFLIFMTEEKKRSIQYVSTSKPDAVKRIKNEEKILEDEIAQSTLQDVPNVFVYDSKPRPREINMNIKAAQGSMIPRHADRKINALVKADYCCEINKEHPTFKRRKSDKNYTETHHLIPIEFSAQFQYTLDTEENIVSLCSNCHNQIHYGAGAEVLLKRLYDERKEALEKAGLGETVNGIKMDLVQLLHMYGLD